MIVVTDDARSPELVMEGPYGHRVAYLGDTARFLREFARDPLHTAAVAPSSAALAAAMVAPVPAGGVVVELGPGTGAFTRALQARGPARHLAVELNPRWAARLAGGYPDVDVARADAGTLPELLAERGIESVDAVVSGLPWVAYAGGGLHRVIADALAPTGVFTQFAYSATRWAPPARRQLAELRTHFAEVTTTPVVWRNLPPAVVHRARMPLRG